MINVAPKKIQIVDQSKNRLQKRRSNNTSSNSILLKNNRDISDIQSEVCESMSKVNEVRKDLNLFAENNTNSEETKKSIKYITSEKKSLINEIEYDDVKLRKITTNIIEKMDYLSNPRSSLKGVKLVDPNIQFYKNITSIAPKEIANRDMYNFLMKPLPKEKTLICKIVKISETPLERLYPRYFLYINSNSQFLLAAQKVYKTTSICYLISMNPDNFDTHSEYYIGKISSNFLGNEFNIFDCGKKPSNKITNEAEYRRQLGSIKYVKLKYYTK